MERHTPTDLHVCHEELAFAVVEEANKPRPFFIRPESTIAGVPRLSPAGVELGGWATLLLLSPRASGGLARAWRIAPEDDVKFAIPLPHTGGTRLRAVAPFAGILPERGGFPSVVSHSRIATYLQSHGTLLTQNGISEAQLHALVKLFIALGTHGVFQDDWVGGYTRASLELAAGLAWSLVLLSAPMSRESLPGWLFPPELRASGEIDERGPCDGAFGPVGTLGERSHCHFTTSTWMAHSRLDQTRDERPRSVEWKPFSRSAWRHSFRRTYRGLAQKSGAGCA